MKHKGRFHTSQGGPQHFSRGGTLVGVFIGIVLGVLGAAVAVWFMNNKVPSPFVSKPAQVADATQPGNDVDQPLAGKPGDPPPKRFEFYDILPGTDKPGSERKPPAEPADSTAEAEKPATTTPPSAKAENGATPPKEETPPPGKPQTSASTEPVAVAAAPLYMQAGSFQDSADADNQKAKLALLGFEASVLQVMVQDRTWYRVRIGPYANPEEAGRARNDLARHGIQVVYLR